MFKIADPKLSEELDKFIKSAGIPKKQFMGVYIRYSVYDISKYFKDWRNTKKNLQLRMRATEKVK